MTGFGKDVTRAAMAFGLNGWQGSGPSTYQTGAASVFVVPHQHRRELVARAAPSLVSSLPVPCVFCKSLAGREQRSRREPPVPCMALPFPLLRVLVAPAAAPGCSQSPGGARPQRGSLWPWDWVAPAERRRPQQRASPVPRESGVLAAPGGGTASSKAPRHRGVFCLAHAKPLSPLLLLSIFSPAFLIKEDYRFPSLSPGFILKRLNDMLTP